MNETFKEKAPEVVKWLMRDFGFTEAQACGVVGNIGRESGGFVYSREIGQPPGRGGYGWCQWTGPRARIFLNWCQAHHLDWHSDEGNYGYLRHELQTSYAYVVSHVKEAPGLAGATEAFEHYYERAGVPAMADRIAWAQAAADAYRAAQVDPSPSLVKKL